MKIYAQLILVCLKLTLILQDGSGSMDFDEFCEMMMTKADGPEEK